MVRGCRSPKMGQDTRAEQALDQGGVEKCHERPEREQNLPRQILEDWVKDRVRQPANNAKVFVVRWRVVALHVMIAGEQQVELLEQLHDRRLLSYWHVRPIVAQLCSVGTHHPLQDDDARCQRSVSGEKQGTEACGPLDLHRVAKEPVQPNATRGGNWVIMMHLEAFGCGAQEGKVQRGLTVERGVQYCGVCICVQEHEDDQRQRRQFRRCEDRCPKDYAGDKDMMCELPPSRRHLFWRCEAHAGGLVIALFHHRNASSSHSPE
mmetsp:Transcript_74750/g.188203  ORF Transcript_74750/g.188203 Transcript_74750/m.188203 type:complete len:264 (-) Transcript_74750:242-1033(-)